MNFTTFYAVSSVGAGGGGSVASVVSVGAGCVLGCIIASSSGGRPIFSSFVCSRSGGGYGVFRIVDSR